MNRIMKKRAIDHDNVGYLMILPFYLFLFTFILLPIVLNVIISFTDYNMRKMSFVGIENYRKLIRDPILIQSIKNTLVYTVATLFFVLVIGFLAASGLVSLRRGASFFRTCIFMPYVISMASASVIFLWIYDPGNGFLNQILGAFGLQYRQWLYSPSEAIWDIIAMSIWKFVGYNMVIYTSGLLGIPGQLYEAATIDGAGTLGKVYYIMLPMLRPVIFFLFVTGLINNFNVFEQVNILTAGGPINSTTTIMHQVYRRAFFEYRMGYAASITMLLLVVVIIITALNFRFGSRGQDLDLS